MHLHLLLNLKDIWWFSFMWHFTQLSWMFRFQKTLPNNPKTSFFYKFQLIIVWKLQKIWVSDFRGNLGCVPYARSWVFFQNFQNTAFLLLYYSARKKATAMVFIWGDRRYHAFCFEYKTAYERYWDYVNFWFSDFFEKYWPPLLEKIQNFPVF